VKAARWLAVLAGLPLLALFVSAAAGWRPCVGVIAGGGGACSDVGAGVTYALAWFGTITLTPVLAVAALIALALDRALSRKAPLSRRAPLPPKEVGGRG
jgi:hypothetical protein